jgi:ATP-binding cassette, subfamily C, bacterial
MTLPASAKPDPASSGIADDESAKGSGQDGSTARTLLGLMRYAMQVDPRALALTIAAELGGSLAEGLGLVLLLPLLSVAGVNFTGSSTASRLGFAVQRMLVGAGVPHSLWLPVVLGIFLATGALRSVLRRSQSMMVYATATRVELALSRRVYEAVVKAQWGFLVRQRAGGLTHLLTEELRRVAEALILSLSIVNLMCLTLLYLVVAMKLSAAMTLLVLVMGGALLMLQRGSLGHMRVSGKELYESVGEVYAATEERLLNLKSVKTNNAEDRDVQMFADLCQGVARSALGNAKHQAGSAFGFEVGSLVALGTVIFLALGVLHVQPATMLLLLAIFTRLMPQLATLQSQGHQVASILPSFDHVLAIEAECLAHAEPQALDTGAATAPLGLKSEFRLENVWFAYETSEPVAKGPEFVLRGVDLPIEAGMLTAVIGPSGAGKSTIADLVNGLLLPTRGRLLLDGRALSSAETRRWRGQVGYVGQETVLFHQSVRENLLWAQPEATGDEMREALLLASAAFVYDLPGGLETIVGDRGILLSSGQRQRISLARALLRKPTLLILDEATNALDVENEARVLDAIREVIRNPKRGREGVLTVLMIAHRASAIRRADRIFELADGRVARSGTWEDLSRPA